MSFPDEGKSDQGVNGIHLLAIIEGQTDCIVAAGNHGLFHDKAALEAVHLSCIADPVMPFVARDVKPVDRWVHISFQCIQRPWETKGDVEART